MRQIFIKELTMNLRRTLMVFALAIFSMITNSRTASASLVYSMSTNASATVTSPQNIDFVNGTGTNSQGSIVNYTANSLNSSATFTVMAYDSSTTYHTLERVVEEFTNNTGRTLTSLTISLTGTNGMAEFLPMYYSSGTNVSYPSQVSVTYPNSVPTVANISPGATFSYGANNTSITITFRNALAVGQTFNYYVPLVTDITNPTTPQTNGTLTFTESATAAPEPSTLISALCGTIFLGGFGLVRRRKGVLSQAA